MTETDTLERKPLNDNARYGRLWPELSRSVIETELRHLIERWLHRGVPPERLNEIVFGLSKDLTCYGLQHDPAGPDRAMERYEQVCHQAGVLQLLECLTLEAFVKLQGEALEDSTA